MKTTNRLKKIAAILSVILLTSASLYSCNNTDGKGTDDKNEVTAPGYDSYNDSAENNLTTPEDENKKEEIKVNENYADSEIYDFTGTIDEIYQDGSILVFSPDFRVLNYNVIVEFDENSVIDGFELAENQHIKFEVYSQTKKSEPLTVVAAKLTLLNEVSTQHEEEEQRIKDLQEKADALVANQ